MMNDYSMASWRNPWFQWSIYSLCGATVVTVLVGSVLLPSVHADFSAQGIWAGICRSVSTKP